MSLHKFYFDAATLARVHRWRYGQAIFNHLTQIRPDLAEIIRGTDKGPFYVENLHDPRWDRFVEFIETKWGREEPT